MPRFQAIFSDIDGTLLNPQHQLSPRNRAAGRAVAAAGIPIVLVSARPPAAMRPLAEALGPGLPLIALNGALILDGADRIIQQRALSPAALAILATLLAEAPALLRHDYCGRHWYCADPTHPRCRRETAIIGLEPEPRPAASGPVHKVLLLGPAALISHWAERLGAALPTLNVQRSKADYLEITAAGADKAEALRWLCARQGWNPARVLALGDSDNDRPLLKAAGHGVALAQAPAAVQAAADEVAPSNGDDGWAVVLEREFLA